GSPSDSEIIAPTGESESHNSRPLTWFLSAPSESPPSASLSKHSPSRNEPKRLPPPCGRKLGGGIAICSVYAAIRSPQPKKVGTPLTSIKSGCDNFSVYGRYPRVHFAKNRCALQLCAPFTLSLSPLGAR